jgi:hypothetical protein
MASRGDFFGGQFPQGFSIADFVEAHVRDAEQRWEGRGLVALSAQILMVQVMESVPPNFFQFGDQTVVRSRLLQQIHGQFQPFLDTMLDQSRALRTFGPIRDVPTVTAFTVALNFSGWLRRNCECAPQ